jgi:hypothetical protein
VRLRDEPGYDGPYSTVQRYARRRREEMARERDHGDAEGLLTLSWLPGEARADFGEAGLGVRGVAARGRCLTVAFPRPDAGPARVFRGEASGRVCQGLRNAFGFAGGVPRRAAFDNATEVGGRVRGGAGPSGPLPALRGAPRARPRPRQPLLGQREGQRRGQGRVPREEPLRARPVVPRRRRVRGEGRGGRRARRVRRGGRPGRLRRGAGAARGRWAPCRRRARSAAPPGRPSAAPPGRSSYRATPSPPSSPPRRPGGSRRARRCSGPRSRTATGRGGRGCPGRRGSPCRSRSRASTGRTPRSRTAGAARTCAPWRSCATPRASCPSARRGAGRPTWPPRSGSPRPRPATPRGSGRRPSWCRGRAGPRGRGRPTGCSPTLPGRGRWSWASSATCPSTWTGRGCCAR